MGDTKRHEPKASQHPVIEGNWAPVLLPILPDESIDFSKLAKQVEVLISAGVDGIYTNGSAGEFFSQREDEFDKIQALVADYCIAEGVPFQIGASHMSAQISMDRIRRCKNYFPAAFQVILPAWYPLSIDETISFLGHMAEISKPVGLVLYNPPHSKRVLSPAEFGQLKQAVPTLLGIKVAGGDKRWYSEMASCCNGLSIFMPGHDLATGIARGAQGSYSNVAALQPKRISAVV